MNSEWWARTFAAALLLAATLPCAAQTIRINELLAINDTGLQDEDDDRSDWLELYNAGDTPAELGGWFLSDDPAGLDRWALPAVRVPAGGCLLVFASGKDRAVEGAPLHTDFRLDGDGETLRLLLPDGLTVADAVTFEEQRADVSQGRYPDGDDGWRSMPAPTPGAPNNAGQAGGVRCLPEAGTFTNRVIVVLRATNDATRIHYTLDGALPGGRSPIYSQGLMLTQSTLVRARSYHPVLGLGPVVSAAYVKIESGLAGFSSDLPLVVVDTFGKGELPDVNPKQAGCLLVFERGADGRSALTSAPALGTRAGFHRRGESTLRNTSTKPSLAVETWSDGADTARPTAPLGLPADSDWILHAPYDIDRAMIRNPLIYTLHGQAGHYAVRTRLVEVFLNAFDREVTAADYAGVYVLMERIKRDPDRVNVARLEPWQNTPPEITGGYVLKSDKSDAGRTGFQTSRGTPRHIYANPPAPNFYYVDPQEEELTATQRAWVTNYFEAFEQQLFAGNRDPATGYPRYIDTGSFVDFWLFNLFMKNSECAFNSQFMYIERGGRLAMGPLWDFDRTAESYDARDDNPAHWDCDESWSQWNGLMTGPWGYRLFQDPDFWQLTIDRWAELRGGVLSLANVGSVIATLTNELAEAQVRNYARWPDAAPRTSWRWENENLRQWLGQRVAWMDGEFLAAPALSLAAGAVTNGTLLRLSGPAGATLYYTTNGRDPRQRGGAVDPAATAYAAPLRLAANTLVTVRAFREGWSTVYAEASDVTITSRIPWSAPASAVYVVQSPALAITELMYHPRPPQGAETNASPDGADFEFIEIRNIGAAPASLLGVAFTAGVTFDFTHGAVTNVPVGGCVVVARNLAAFASRYGARPGVLAGAYAGALDNDGERVTLTLLPTGEELATCAYAAAWYPNTAGRGFALNARNPAVAPAFPDSAASWRPGSVRDGTPGTDDPGTAPPPGAVVINEILTHQDADNPGDWIELANTTTQAVALAGWYLTDDLDDPFKFRIAQPATLAPGAYAVFTEFADFGPGVLGGRGFALSELGDAVYLLSATNGVLTGCIAGETFGPVARDVTLGRHRRHDGTDDFTALGAATAGAGNAAPRVGPVVIGEIMYRSAAGGEYVELQNLAAFGVPLFDPAYPLHTWQLAGAVTFTFPTNVVVPAGGRVIVAGVPPEAFTRAYPGLPGAVRCCGPYGGRLAGDGESLRLLRPLPPEPGGFVPYEVLDRVDYADAAPWPALPPGAAVPLERLPVGGYGNDAANWVAGVAPSPGSAPLAVALAAPGADAVLFLPCEVRLEAVVNERVASGPGRRVAFFANGVRVGETDVGPPYAVTWRPEVAPGTWALDATLTDGVGGTWAAPALRVHAATLRATGASAVADRNVRLNGVLAGPATADVRVVWGAADCGTNAGAWTHGVVLSAASGAFGADVEGLTPGQGGWYRCVASNAWSVGWSAPVAFTAGAVSLDHWSRRQCIRFPGYSRTPLTNFPVLVTFATNRAGFAYSQFASSTGADLRFLAADDATPLDHEIESWNPAGDSHVWVRLPVLAAGASMWAYWGNPHARALPPAAAAATWRAGYAGVWHLATAAVTDSSTNAHVAAVATGSLVAGGVVGGARAFADTQVARVPDAPALHGSAVTVAAWVRVDTFNNPWNLIASKWFNPSAQDWHFAVKSRRLNVFLTNAEDLYGATTFAAGTWYHTAFTLDAAGEVRMYVNGLEDGRYPATAGKVASSASSVQLADERSGLGLNGVLDEVRVSAVARSPDWIWACWRNQSGAAGFSAYDGVQTYAFDGDGDGLPDQWERTHFGGTNQPRGAAGDDYDGDGQPNGDELRAGTAPDDPRSVLAWVAAGLEVGGRRLVWRSVTNRTYAIRVSTNLAAGWAPTPLTSGIPGHASGTNVFTDDRPAPGPVYYRVRCN